jgi:osmotically inducible protein OsmC
MAVRKSSAVWKGDLKGGQGSMKLGSGAFEGQYSFASRFENGTGTNPEELIGAAHAGCFSMALAHGLAEAGHAPRSISTQASVHLEKRDQGWTITRVELRTEGDVPGMDKKTFLQHAQEAKKNCPVSRLLTGAEIQLEADLKS